MLGEVSPTAPCPPCVYCKGRRVFLKDGITGKRYLRYTCPDCLGEFHVSREARS